MKSKFLRKFIAFTAIFIALLITFQLYSSPFKNSENQKRIINSSFMTMRLELFTSDINKTVNFYQDVLGFKSLKSNSSAYQPIQKGQVILGIGLLESLGSNHYFNSKKGDIQFGYGVEIVLEVDDIQLVYNKVKEANIDIESELKKQPWGLTDFRITDPNGYYIRVTSKE